MSSLISPARQLTAEQVHYLASLPAAVRSTVANLRAMGYGLKQAYALAVRARVS